MIEKLTRAYAGSRCVSLLVAAFVFGIYSGVWSRLCCSSRTRRLMQGAGYGDDDEDSTFLRLSSALPHDFCRIFLHREVGGLRLERYRVGSSRPDTVCQSLCSSQFFFNTVRGPLSFELLLLVPCTAP